MNNLKFPNNIIEAYPKEKRTPKDTGPILNIAECFSNTLQGENLSGVPSTFLRLQRCSLQCIWCDTLEVWKVGNPYSVNELLDIWEEYDCINNFKNGQHLILTGGSPVLQQNSLVALLNSFYKRYKFLPIIEIENECTRMPSDELISFVNIWNNSPKLSNSGMKKPIRYKPEIIKKISSLPNSYFKFVISSEQDWKEITEDFLNTSLIDKKQIVVMPEGQTREELQNHYQIAVEMAVKNNVRFSDRLHVTIWNKKVSC